MADKLKPCPFCGGEAEIREIFVTGFHKFIFIAKCRNIGCGAIGSECVKEETAIERWNNRPSPWHTGTPTEEGWYVIAYKPIEQDSPLVYYTLHQWRDAEGYWQSDGIRPNDFWKPIAWQKIEED